jgi:hypothetical protein
MVGGRAQQSHISTVADLYVKECSLPVAQFSSSAASKPASQPASTPRSPRFGATSPETSTPPLPETERRVKILRIMLENVLTDPSHARGLAPEHTGSKSRGSICSHYFFGLTGLIEIGTTSTNDRTSKDPR